MAATCGLVEMHIGTQDAVGAAESIASPAQAVSQSVSQSVSEVVPVVVATLPNRYCRPRALRPVWLACCNERPPRRFRRRQASQCARTQLHSFAASVVSPASRAIASLRAGGHRSIDERLCACF